MAARCWRIDMMVDRGTPDVWAYKRDHSIRMPRAAAVRRNEVGISYLAPASGSIVKEVGNSRKKVEDGLDHK
ncbi:hypothetical protein RWK44_33785 [Rhizobium sp. 25PS6]|uniref:Uncharacterized protein n=1 Tax=Rhizobium laguerreae TaxID=1076926 RepID=A0AB35FKI5_9HYPH|nr:MULTISPECIES: hypothetical protein [Rhizobium]MBN9984313.1 hypothetical protein [Rhizobium laguerreae]MBY3066183.1 hypothetical protein [Rhizobium laguerreae]MBY3070831.1 hypothetical protein [Rhizobium laguerreae]MBY3080653.1 hypothetical protein [Rhizobium laguerreae]MBY3114188.1 hypothetical protein [Rhizobium laguerreae]